jgi:hypothetical protein
MYTNYIKPRKVLVEPTGQEVEGVLSVTVEIVSVALLL